MSTAIKINSFLNNFFNTNLEDADNELFKSIKDEFIRQQNHIELIASENIVSKAVLEAQEFIEANYREKLSIEEIAEKVNVSGRNFIRRFKKATSNTPLEYVQRVKIEAAKKLIESSTLHIQEVMFDVGYNDDQAFRKVFKNFTCFFTI